MHRTKFLHRYKKVPENSYSILIEIEIPNLLSSGLELVEPQVNVVYVEVILTGCSRSNH